MPNWVTVQLIFDNFEDANRVFDGMQWHNKRFSFKSLIPHPATREECEVEYLLNEPDPAISQPNKPWFNWDKWNCAKWGTKWDAHDGFLADNEIIFETPWSPPCDELCQKIADTFHVSFTRKGKDESEKYCRKAWTKKFVPS